ncbi:golgin subfamily A member 6-like protein 22 [Cajanus cajan]|uniref:golgin subfamily A member 6-like protein 22 n=1 Tax=Cajanus cajan TaxID=3821 RepID=UPI00098DBEEE|nr:golgin subfamily A member 6-like protein 22 [Cajanus cajan]XP_029126421.1 golgin subfamily A member 6-like protein 22 [Cajanus cajan]
MFKSWSKKNKIKAVFKLDFQATQVPKMKKSAIMVSLVPDDVGKTTVKLEKTAVQDGTCSWENPVFEPVKLVRDAKSGKIHEKIYHFIVSTGSSKSGFLGEASIDFADFVAETEPLTISLPLKFANSGIVLHVTIQNVEGYTAESNGEYNGAEGLCSDGSLKHQLSYGSTDHESYNVDENGHMARTRSEYSEQDASNGISPGVASWEDPYSFRQNSMPSKRTVKEAIATENQVHERSNTNWSIGSASDGSLGDWTNSLEDNLPRERLHEPSDNATEKLKSEISSLKRQAEVSEIELQSLRKQIEKESSRGQNLSRQIISLREERDLLKTKYEQLKSQQNFNSESKTPKIFKSEIEDTKLQLEAIKEELVYEKELNANLQLQMRKTQDSNSELLLAVTDLEAMLEQKNKEILDLSTNKKSQRTSKQYDDATELDLLRQKIADQNDEIDNCYKQREELSEQIKDLTSEYDLLKKENVEISLRLKQDEAQHIMLQSEHSSSLVTIQQLESQVERLEEKLKAQEDEFSASLVCIKELENEVKSLEKELKMQADKFEEDLHAMQCAKTEQEERAIQAEEALRKTRHNNAVASERFEEEYRLLSVEMSQKVEENEKMTMKAVGEADELRHQNKLIEEMLHKCNQELRLITEQNDLKMQELLDQIDSKSKTIKQMSQELEVKSKQLEDAERHREEKDASFSKQIQMLRSQIKMLMEEDAFETKLTKNLADMAREDAKIAHKGRPLMMPNDEMILGTLLSEVETFKNQHNEIKHSLHKEKVEKENMKKHISQLEGELKKKETELNAMEKKLKNNKGRAAVTNMNLASKDNECAEPPTAKAHVQKAKSVRHKGTDAASAAVSKSEAGKIGKSTENKVCLAPGSEDTNELLNEVALLKERNKTMESELKDMEERYSEISLKFAEVEGERQQLVMALRNLKNGKKN